MGIGNLLLGDEGVGVHAAQALAQEKLADGVEVVEVGTAFLDALPALEGANRIIVLDAMNAEGKPGTVYRILLDHCERRDVLYSLHGFDIFRMLELSENRNDPEVVVFGMEPAHIGWSTELSAPVSKALFYLLEAVREEVKY